MSSVATAIYVAILLFGGEFANAPRSIDDVLKNHGLPLYAATSVQIQSTWDETWPARANRLITVGFRLIETEEQARKLSGGIIIYCSEPKSSRGLGDLILGLHATAENMARSSPMAKELLGPPTIPLKAPMKVRLVFLDGRGGVKRTERRDIIELKSSPDKSQELPQR
jgi:hypothetical protein